MADDPLLRVAPDLRPFIELLPDLSDLDRRLDEVRVLLGGEEITLGSDGVVEVSAVEVPREGSGTFPCLLYRPLNAGSAPLPALLHIHGGGYVAGSAKRDDLIARQVAEAAGCVVLVPDYRLAPEFPYPAPLDDCRAAWSWLCNEADRLGIDSEHLAIRGISAGGGLALALALALRSGPAPQPCYLLLVFPMIDNRTDTHRFNGQYVWTDDCNRFGWTSYLKGQDRHNPDPLAVPARIGDVSGLSPVFLATGSIDLFVGENLDLARALTDAGISLEMHIYPGAYHGFTQIPCEATRAYVRDSMTALRRAFGQAEGDR